MLGAGHAIAPPRPPSTRRPGSDTCETRRVRGALRSPQNAGGLRFPVSGAGTAVATPSPSFFAAPVTVPVSSRLRGQAGGPLVLSSRSCADAPNDELDCRPRSRGPPVARPKIGRVLARARADAGKNFTLRLTRVFLGPIIVACSVSPPPPPQRATHNAKLNERRSGAGRSATSFLRSCAAVPGGVSIPVTGCGPGVKNAPGAPSACRDTDSPSLVRGAGIESRHIRSMADRTIRHLLANPVLERATAPNREATNDAATVEALPAAAAAERPELALRRRLCSPTTTFRRTEALRRRRATSSAARARGAAAPRLRTTAREARPQQDHRGREG